MKRSIFPLIILVCFSAHAQDIMKSRVIWTVSGAENLKTSERLDYACRFVSDGTTIKWLQKNQSRETLFTIVSTEGSWSNVTRVGEITFKVSKADGTTGTLRFTKEGAGGIILLDFSGSDEYGARYRFHVNRIEIQ